MDELPFAGLHDVTADPETASFVVYGVAATLHPLDQSIPDDEGVELVPWPEGSSNPVLVDRFDFRLLLDPSDLANGSTVVPRQRHGFTNLNTAIDDPAATLASEIAEIQEERWRDLFHPPPHLHHFHHHYSSEDDDEERKRTHGAAIPFTYTDLDFEKSMERDAREIKKKVNDHSERVYYLEDLEPPPPPLHLDLLHDRGNTIPGQPAPSLISFLITQNNIGTGGGGGGRGRGDAHRTGLLPFTARQYAIMERTAEFLRTHGDQGGAEILYERAFSDPTFAFLSPSHIWNKFFKGLVDQKIQNAAETANLEKEKEGENLLGALLGGYGSEKEEREEEKEEENGKGREKLAVVTAIIAHLIKATTSSSSSAPTTIQSISLAQIIQQRLSTDPVIASFIHPEAPFHNVFKDAIESAVAAGAMDENIAGVWLGNSIKSKLSVPDSDAAMKGNGATEVAGKKEIKEKKEEPVSIRVAENEKKIKKEKNTSKSRSIPELDANKLEKRKEKVRLLLERQRQVAEERRQGQAAAAAAAEKERTKHLAAISVHKRMFLDNSDDE